MKLSIVTTLYQSAPYVVEFHRRVSAEAAAITADYELVMVDVGSLTRHREQNTAIGGLWAITGYRQVGIAVEKGHRGDSVYSFRARVRMGFEGLTSFSEKPLIMVFVLGLAIFALSSIGAFYLI